MTPLLRLFATLILAQAILAAQGPGRLPLRHYGNENGLSSEVVTSMAQTADGRVWAGTEAGPVYFDGQGFVPFAGTLPSGMTTDLFADADGSLWVATYGGVARIQGGRARVLGEAEGLAPGMYPRVGRDAFHHLWVLGTGAIFIENGPMNFVKAQAFPVPGRPIQMFVDPACREVLAITSKAILQWRGDRWEVLPGPPIGPREEFLNLAKDGSEAIWVRSGQALWQRPKGGGWRRERANMGGGYNFSSRLERDAQGWVWFDDADGLWRMNGDQRARFSRPDEEARGGLVDREGGIWIRTDRGINRTLGQGRWQLYDRRDGLATDLAWQPIRDHLGQLWVGTEKGLCVSTRQGFREVLPGRILSLAVAPDGHVWAAGSPGGTVFEIDPRTLAVQARTVDVLPRARITAGLAVDADGTPWVADQYAGVARGTRKGQDWAWSAVTLGGRPISAVQGLIAVPGGGLIAIHDGTASLMRNGIWNPIPDLLPELPACVAFGPDGLVAFGYRHKPMLTLHRLEGDRILRTGVVPLQGAGNGLYTIFSIGIDAAGQIWVGSSAGLGRMAGTGAADFRMLGTEDRLVSPECNEWAMLVEPGRIWLGTTSGLAAFDSALPLARPELAMPLVLSARAGALELDPTSPALELPRRNNELEITFLVPSYQVPDRIRYQAWMEGVDPGWVQLESPSLRYPGLRAGKHVLRLRGVLPGGSEGPVRTLPFTVTPAWWETPWAQGLGLLALAGSLWSLFWLRHLALQARNRQLQEEVARQTSALQEASRAKSAFLANMSHELRTPLNAILLYSELLQEDAKERGLASSIEDAARISQAGSSLLNLIDDILDISKIEAGHMQLDLEEVPMGPFLDQLDTALRPVVERKGNRFLVERRDAPAGLRTDSTRLQQILANLLGNAAKFTEDGTVTLRVAAVPDGTVFEVEDTGIGMTGEEQQKVFSEFVQADSSTTRKYGGTGLGLALVQRLTLMLGGSVHMASEPGVGTRVTIRIPSPV